jgi:protein tyrosine phosphatase
MPAILPNETRTVDKLALSISPVSSHGNDEELMLNSSRVARVVLPAITISNVTSDVNSKRSLVVRLPLTIVKHRVKTLMPLNVHVVLVEASLASSDVFLHKKLGVAILERSRDQVATETMVLRRHDPHLHHAPAIDDHVQHRNQGQGNSHDQTAGSPWTVANISQRFQDSISGLWLVLESSEPTDFLSGRILPSLAVDKHRTRVERHIRHAFNVGLQENTVNFRLPANSLSNATTFRAIVVYELVIDNQTLLLGFSVCNDSIILPAALLGSNDGVVIDIWTILLAVGTFLILLIVICVFLFLHLRKRRHKQLEIEAQTRAKSSIEQRESVAGDQANTRLLRSSKLNMMQLSERRKTCSTPAEETTFCSQSSLPIGSLGNSINRRVLGGPFLDVGDMPEFWNIPKVERRLMDEFASLPTGFVYSTAVANLPQNEPFNRSHFVVPYDRNRVDVPMVACTFPLRSSSYINASVVSSARGNIFYVTQTPMSVCQEQFWLMVWNYNISSVVMLTDLNDSRARLARFWPLRKQGTVQYGSIAITINSERSTAHSKFYALKLVSLKCEREKRLVYLWQFVSWLEYGVPNSTFAFLEFVRDIRRGESRESAVCVVCPTGGGRSGLYVALDSLLDEGHETESVNVFRTVARLRRERPNLVRTKAQYLFLYQAVIDHFSYVGKEVSPSAVFSGRDIKTEFRQLIDSFKTPPPVYDPDQSTLRSVVPMHSTSQSPASEILHEAVCEPSPVMTSTPLTKKDLSKKQQQQAMHGHVILADCAMIRRVDTFHHRDAMLLLPASISVDSEAFWQMLYEEKAAMLINVDHGGAAIGSDDIQHWPRLTVKRGSTHCLESFSYRDIKLSQAPRSSPNKKLRHYVFRCWPRDEDGDGVDTLPPPAQLITFLRVVVHWYSRCCEDGRAPVAVYSAHTQNRAVLFSVLWNVVERLQTQHYEHAGHAPSIDIFNLVRHTYTNIIPHLTQVRSTHVKCLYSELLPILLNAVSTVILCHCL